MLDRQASPGIYTVAQNFNFWSASRSILAGKWLILELVILFVVIALVITRIQTPLYTAKAIIAPQENNGTSMQSGSSALQALGSLSGLDISHNGTIDEFTQLLDAPSTAALMEQRDHVLRRIFSHDWNKPEGRWIIPSGPIAWTREGFYSLLGLSVQSHPDEFKLANYVSRKVSVTKVRSSNLVTLEYASSDRFFAAEFLANLCAAADVIMRDAVRERAAVNVAFLQAKLQSVQSADLRTALITLLEQQEKALMLASSGDTYAFRFVQPPLAESQPSWPAPFRILAVAVLLALMSGASLSLFLFSVTQTAPLPRLLQELRARRSFTGIFGRQARMAMPVPDEMK
jgi:uncharacterized protein involved in exopolysaccharide biosynthesis